jgi:molecular chaperone DnaK
LADARAKGYTRFDKVILVGGATRMPQIRDRVVAELNTEPEIYDPDEAVAKGAALYALKESLLAEVQDFLTTQTTSGGKPAQPLDLSEVSEEEVTQALDHLEKSLGLTLTGPVRELVNTRIVNVLSKSLGVIARNEQSLDVVCYLLPRNSEVPLERMTDFGTDADNQSAVDIRVMSGERDSPDPLDCQEVGVASLSLPDRLPARSPIRVKFAISKDGRLDVSATDLTGGASIDVEFQTEAVLSADEVTERSTALRLLNVS